MEQFKKLYHPVLKPVRPGEARPPAGRTDIPRFDFSKRFAEMARSELLVPPSAQPGAPSGESLPPMETEKEESPKELKEHEMDHSQKISGSLKISLRGNGAFRPVPVPLPVSTPTLEPSADTPSSQPGLSSGTSTSSDPPDCSISDDASEPPKPASPSLQPSGAAAGLQDITVLDKSLLECRGRVLELQEQLVRLAADLPRGMSMLEEKIVSLHNLKLDFMLEFDSDHK